ncbi:MAG: rod shape-determining protein [Clostridia bacterium]|nr:rod shape-determining protein [Clostridia bacterium]
MKLMAKDIGIDLGTSTTLVYVKGSGVVLNEPTVVAINDITGEVLAVGGAAKEMLGRTPDNIVAVKPLKGGVIANFYGTRMMLEEFISKAAKKSVLTKPRVVICVPSGITDVEAMAVEQVAADAGAKEVYIMEEAMAAAIGAGIKVDSPEGSMIVDIGGGTTEVAVISLGGIVASNAIRLAGDNLDHDIIEYIKDKYNVIIGENIAEEIKNTIGAAFSSMTEERMQVKGRNLSTGLPDTITVTTSDIEKAMSRILEEIVKTINLTLEKTPPELASDIMERGIIICGGGAYIKNIDRYISDKVGIPVLIATNPLECVARGAGSALSNIEVLKKANKTRRR